MRVSLQGRSWPPDIYYLLAYHFPAVLSHLKRLFIYRKFNFVVEDKQSGMKDKFIILSRIFFKNRQDKKKTGTIGKFIDIKNLGIPDFISTQMDYLQL